MKIEQKSLDYVIQETKADMIVDLYELRSKMTTPRMSSRDLAPAHEVFQYNWLNTIIANLTDKYGLKYTDIEDALHRRELKEQRKIIDMQFTNETRFQI